MQTQKNKKIGLSIIILGTIAFFISIFLFNQSGTMIEYKNVEYMLKMLLSYGILVATLYGGLYFAHSKKLANQIAGGMAICLVIAYILGIVLH